MKLNRRQRRLGLRRRLPADPAAENPAASDKMWRELADAEFNLASGMAYPAECAKSRTRFMVDKALAAACSGCPFEAWCRAMYEDYLDDELVTDMVFRLELADFVESVKAGETPKYRPSKPTNGMADWPLPF